MALTINIDFEASIARLEENSRKAASAVSAMADKIDSSAELAKGALVGLAGALSVGAFAAAVRSSIDLADSLNDLSKKTGASVETLSGLRLAAEQSGTSLEGIANGTKKLATSMVEHEAAFAKLGINTKNQTEALIQLGDIFAGMDDPVQRSALAVKVFGKSGDEMLPMLMEGSEGIRRMVERGQELSGITSQMAKDADRFNDALAEMHLRSQNLYVGVAAQLLPVLNETIEAFNALNKSGETSSAVGEALATAFETVVVLGANVAYVFKSVGTEIGGIAAQLTALASGDWEGFKEIGRQMKADADAARKEIDDFSERILNARKVKPKAEEETGGKGDNRGSDLLNALKGTSDEFAKLRQKDIDGWVKYADAVLAESERIETIERERVIKENERAAASELAWTQGVAARVMRIQEANLTEEELERAKLQQIEIDLKFALDQRFITEQQYHELREQELLKHEARMGNIMAQGAVQRQKFTQMTAVQQTQTVLGEMLALTNGVATKNRELFEINKIAGVANAVVNTYTGVSRTLSAYPYPWNLPMAALHLAAGLAQIDAISSAQFGSSTSAPSVGGGGAVPVTNVDAGGGSAAAMAAVPEMAKPKQQVNITLVGSQFSYDQVVNEIIPLLNEASGNGMDIQVAQG